MSKKIALLLIIGLFAIEKGQTQSTIKPYIFTKADSLRGSITPERAWWDLQFYDLSVEVIPEAKTFKGTNLIHYQVLDTNQLMQIDMQYPMQITLAIQGNDTLKFSKIGKIPKTLFLSFLIS